MPAVSPGTKLELRHVAKRFHKPDGVGVLEVLRNIDLSIPEGERYSLIGPSGSGKTTLLNIIAGFEPPTEGEVLLDGHVVRAPGPDRGVVFQEHAVFPWLTAQENVQFGPLVRNRPDLLERSLWYLHLVGLQGFERYYPAQLSGGMRQRLALARVLANEPLVLLMDEPFGALDAQTRSQMHQLLLRIWEQLNPTVLFVTHDVDEAILLSDRVGVLSARPGTLIAEVHVELPQPRSVETVVTERFLQLKRQLLHHLRSGHPTGRGTGGDASETVSSAADR